MRSQKREQSDGGQRKTHSGQWEVDSKHHRGSCHGERKGGIGGGGGGGDRLRRSPTSLALPEPLDSLALPSAPKVGMGGTAKSCATIFEFFLGILWEDERAREQQHNNEA
eukprot:SAG11_NODE_2457_length_3342_cov_3.804194_5_plen_110_part_00